MGDKILVCGLNGAGKSTLARKLASVLDYKFMDIEDYYFTEKNADYHYKFVRTRHEVSELILKDIKGYDNIILASVNGDYGKQISEMFTCIVYIVVPKKLRLERVRNRSYKKFGDRMLPNGDLYQKEKEFFDKVEQRSEQLVTAWLESLNLSVNVIQVDGTKAIEENIRAIRQFLNESALDTVDK